jgi:hypothetical protein
MKLTDSFWLEFRTAVQSDEGLTQQRELDDDLIPRLPGWIVRGGVVAFSHTGVGEHARVELGRLAGLALVEPQARRHLVHVSLLICLLKLW